MSRHGRQVTLLALRGCARGPRFPFDLLRLESTSKQVQQLCLASKPGSSHAKMLALWGLFLLIDDLDIEVLMFGTPRPQQYLLYSEDIFGSSKPTPKVLRRYLEL